MSQLYLLSGITKQGFHQWLNRELKKREEQLQLLPILRQIRADHPRLSCRQMYYMLIPKTMGRDQFERFCHTHGYLVRTVKKFHHTTDSSGVKRFPNLLLSIDHISGFNQVWVSDITYFQIKDQVYYLTFIMDLYSRRLVGWGASQTLRTEDTTLPALSMALARREIPHNSNLIFHSDGGGQYYCTEFLLLTKAYGIRNSMGKSVFENPHAERINETMKNSYLIPYAPHNFVELKVMLEKVVSLYNLDRPHQSIDRCTPDAFERLTATGLVAKTFIVKKNIKVITTEKIEMRITMS
jgi:putative transposase